MRNSGYYDSYYHERNRGPEMTRRNFLKILVPVVAGAAAPGVYEAVAQKTHIWPTFGELLKKLIPQKKDQPPKPTVPKSPAATPSPEITPQTPKETSSFIAGYRVDFNQEGTPIRYSSPDGITINFTTAQIAQFETQKQKAISSQEPEVAFVTRMKDSNPVVESPPSPAHPLKKDKPTDALTPEQLSKRGIQIIQLGKIKLHIRPGAFDKGALLDAFQTNGKKHMVIVLVDGPVVSTNYLKDQRYDQVRILLGQQDNQINEFRARILKDIQQNIDQYRQDLQVAIDKKDETKTLSIQADLIGWKSIFLYYEQIYTDEQLLTEMSMSGSDRGGVYCSESTVARFSKGKFNPDTSVVFIAVGKGNTTANTLEIIINPQGKFYIVESQLSSGSTDFVPKTGKSHPNPDDFIINPQASEEKRMSYPYGAQQPGQIGRHEIEHFKLIDQNPEVIPNYSEYATDMAAMETIKAAWDKWVKSGYRDDSGYYFVFKTPQGYVYTEKLPQESAPLPV